MFETSLLNTGPTIWFLLVILLTIAGVVCAVVLRVSFWSVLVAGGRAFAQLAVVALLVSQLGRSPWFVAGFLLLMLGVASWTAAKRVNHTRAVMAGIAILAGVLPVCGMLFATGVLPPDGLAVAAVVGQLIGGCMTASTLAGRRLTQELKLRRGEVEAGLALGLTSQQARSLVARPVASEALLPALDQTRTVGMVTLPGAFVGLILGGAAPVEAGMIQLLVLVALLAAETITVATTTHLAENGLIGEVYRSPKVPVHH